MTLYLKMLPTICLVLFGLLMLTPGSAHAQAACPPGTIPYGTGQGVNMCGADNSNQAQGSAQAPRAPQPRWESRWGAIATDFAHSSAGASINKASRKSAEAAALAECRSNGGSLCKIETWYSNGCAAMIVGDKGHNSANAATANEAIQKAMALCNSEDSKCHVYYSACSLPGMIQ